MGVDCVKLPAEGLAGIGVDIVEIDRLKDAVERIGDRFLNRIFTPSEQCYCDKKRDRYACYAARFAAKEAVFKTMGTGIAGARWTDVEVCKKTGGCPTVRLQGNTAILAREKGICEILISLSHDRGRAMAFAVAIRKEA
ncbi:holo-ACP synthase [Pelotomaculum terephthalicicum JT]|uniref:holo-ACP synthase n=1 Tax=Pelotomaculum terephthalicicum TaxID=206393 RepID=UPI001F035AB9|nr:holo-ACP synthase [Pelotomaculum terephthalicicum]MCG9967630.1 holo-ACP synthase [Pelotomaculum terephthalicicum JT]